MIIIFYFSFFFVATKPLLRQIENLQAAHSVQVANWDKIEANLTQRLGKTLPLCSLKFCVQ